MIAELRIVRAIRMVRVYEEDGTLLEAHRSSTGGYDLVVRPDGAVARRVSYGHRTAEDAIRAGRVAAAWRQVRP